MAEVEAGKQKVEAKEQPEVTSNFLSIDVAAMLKELDKKKQEEDEEILAQLSKKYAQEI